MSSIKRIFRNILLKYNPIGVFFYLYRQNQQLKRELNTWKVGQWEPGHYYAPQVLPSQLLARPMHAHLDGVSMRKEEQWALLNDLVHFYPSLAFAQTKMENKRYYLQNGYFNNSDAVFLGSMLQHFKPRRIVEIGSGFSSALMLDVNEMMAHPATLIFIEPYPERLRQLIGAQDACTILETFVQHVDLELFSSLEKNDLLFVDSSHVSKYGSDVNHLLFNILPLLKPGVLVHFHDVFYPFEYPHEWLEGGRFWNEAYLLHAFL